MTATRGAISRASSARAGSVARTLVKRRTKPYKTEESRVLAKKRKLNLHTTYTKPPAGFQFLPVGTPDLAERCKELSRLRGLPVNVVNAKPVSKNAADPAHVSHHIHRIGYHFRVEIVDDACQELGYTLYHGKFVKESDLNELRYNSKLAQAMARHGLRSDDKPVRQESDEQVRAAIKELFPRIPEEDLRAIVQHAWEEGSKRVGTNSDMELPRRVQLATIARIRHTYTDYDRLLKAFEWKEARNMVENDCLAKLIEWRGEQDEEDDNELEEIVRETIVIDDDDDGGDDVVNLADDEDSLVEDGGYISDTSVEISHRPAADADLGAESNDERTRTFLDRYRRPEARTTQRYNDIRQKIGVVQQRRRDGIAGAYTTQQSFPSGAYAAQPEVVRVHIPDHGNGLVEINGQLYRREPASTDIPRPESQPVPAQPFETYAAQHSYSPNTRMPQQYSPAANPADRPIASIEPHDDLRRMAITSTSAQSESPWYSTHSRPASSGSEYPGKRRRVDPPLQINSGRYDTRQLPYTASGELVDLTSPRRFAHPQTVRSDVVDLTESPSYHRAADTRHAVYPTSSLRSPASAPLIQALQSQYGPPLEHRTMHTAYSPGHVPSPQFYQQDHRPGFVDAQVAPIQYVPLPTHGTRASNHRPLPRYIGHVDHTSPQNSPLGTRHLSRISQTPAPVHGAPAMVQQVPRERVYPPPLSGVPPPTIVVPITSSTDGAAPLGYAPLPQPIPQPQYYYAR